jgi:hypothetical protein
MKIMWNWLSTLLLSLVLAGGAAAAENEGAQQQADRQLAHQLRQLVRQLNDDRAAERDAAEAELLKLAESPAVDSDQFLELLPAENDAMPLAVRERLRRLRKQVEARMAKSAIAGTTVTLAANDMPLAEVLAAIEKQTANRFIDNRESHANQAPQPGITLDLKDEAFWPAVDRVLDAAQADIYAYGGEDALSIVARSAGEAPRHGAAAYSGPFRIAALEVQAQRNLRQPAGDALKLQLQVAWEPRLKPIALSQPVSAIEAKTDGGEKLAAKQPGAVIDVEVPAGTQAAEMILPFELPARDVARIASLRGTLRALVPGRQAKFRFDDLADAAGKTQSRGGVHVTLEAVRKNNAVWEVHMRLTLENPNESLQSHRGWVFQNLSYLVGKDGDPIDNAGFETTRQTPNEVGIAYLFDLPAGIDGLAWVYETPAAIVELPVEYELTDIRLP